MNELKRLTGRFKENRPKLIFAGDLNSTPQTGVIQYLVDGSIGMSHPDFQGFDYKQILPRFCPMIKEDGFRLKSAYQENPLPWTNYTEDFNDVLDYILLDKSLVVNRTVGPVDADWLHVNDIRGFPTLHDPSG